jgi:predicted PurR-regulated permease PerM
MNNEDVNELHEGYKLPGIRKIITASVIIAFLALGVWYFFDIVAFFFIAGILSIIGHPIVQKLDKLKIGRFRIPHSLSALITLLLMVGVFIAFVAFVIPIIAKQAQTISRIDVDEVALTYDEPLSKLEATLVKYGLLNEGETINQTVSEQVVKIMNYIDVSIILQNLLEITGFLFVGVFAVLFMTFFFLKENKLFFNGILLFIPRQYKSEAINILHDSKRLLTRYFVGLGIELLSMITLITTGGLILGIENAFLVGFLGGMMNIIPYLGPIIGATIGALLVATTHLGADLYTELLPMVGGILGVFIISNLIDNLVLIPVIYSNSVLAHPLEIFIVILMAGSLAGIPGMIFAIPGYTVLRIVLREFLIRYEFVQQITRRISEHDNP